MTRRTFVLLLAIVLMGLLLSMGCSKGETAATAQEAKSEESELKESDEGQEVAAQGTGKSVTVTMLAPTGDIGDSLTGLAKEYSKMKPGVRIEIVAFGYDDLYDKAMTLVRAKSPEVDLFAYDDMWIVDFGPGDHLVPLDEKFGYERDPDVPSILYDALSWPSPVGPIVPSERGKETHLYSLPFNGNCVLYVIRKDVLIENGLIPPRTWDDALEIAKKVNDPNNRFYGTAFRGAMFRDDSLPVFQQYGGRVVDENFEPAYNSNGNLAAATMISEMSKYGAPGMGEYGTTDLVAAFATGQAMQGLIWPGDSVKSLEDPAQSKVAGGKLYYMLPPIAELGQKPRTVLGEWGIGISSYSKNQREAYEFITWATNREQALKLADAGAMPIHRSVFADPQVNFNAPWLVWLLQAQTNTPYMKPEPRLPGYMAIKLKVLGPRCSDLVGGRLTPEQFVETVDKEIREILAN